MFTPRALSAAALVIASGLLALPGPARAQPMGCAPPMAPYVPSDSRDVQDYADLIGDDFETYIDDFEAYMVCLDRERARAFEEARVVTADYGRFIELVDRLGLSPE